MRRVAFLAAVLLATPALADGFSSSPSAASTTPLTTADQSSTANGKAWSVATGVVSVPANQQLDVVLSNPAANACTAMFTLRRYTNPNNATLQFQSYTNPTVITANTANVGNRAVGLAPSSGLSFGYAARAAGSMGGTAGVASTLFANSEEKIDVPLVVKPGATYGVSITAPGGGLLASAATLAVTFVGYCL